MPKRNVVQEIRSATRRKYTAEEKIRIVLEGLSRAGKTVSGTVSRHNFCICVGYTNGS